MTDCDYKDVSLLSEESACPYSNNSNTTKDCNTCQIYRGYPHCQITETLWRGYKKYGGVFLNLKELDIVLEHSKYYSNLFGTIMKRDDGKFHITLQERSIDDGPTLNVLSLFTFFHEFGHFLIMSYTPFGMRRIGMGMNDRVEETIIDKFAFAMLLARFSVFVMNQENAHSFLRAGESLSHKEGLLHLIELCSYYNYDAFKRLANALAETASR